ncbi:site-specific DNA-methyltransferase (adenine-specific) [Chitinophaga sp. YR573]|uniref:DNA methyltransferase n=1 Tax=Chitinophaga sp. YR573 TaxID=1881040 RepID=UPI0008ACABB4|nr:DNA methyltransferase [Chitinophaga sp. YR573]SEV88645.1 site-specific DNA-methyltransferase (adenine-specific) [Chitinophaga sp. YR573]
MLELNRLYNMDCMDGMMHFPDKYFDLAIVDPPYGIGEDGGKSESRCRKTGVKPKKYKKKTWDSSPPPIEYFNELIRVSKNQIIWGANHFIDRIPLPSSCWIVWDKVNGENDFADCELAYTSFKTAVRQVKYMWHGFMQGAGFDGRMNAIKSKNEKRIHPTQKPIAIYKWLLDKYAKPGHKILDTHGGSCSSLIACIDLNFEYVGFEIDEEYYQDAIQRIEDFKSQLKLF